MVLHWPRCLPSLSKSYSLWLTWSSAVLRFRSMTEYNGNSPPDRSFTGLVHVGKEQDLPRHSPAAAMKPLLGDLWSSKFRIWSGVMGAHTTNGLAVGIQLHDGAPNAPIRGDSPWWPWLLQVLLHDLHDTTLVSWHKTSASVIAILPAAMEHHPHNLGQ